MSAFGRWLARGGQFPWNPPAAPPEPELPAWLKPQTPAPDGPYGRLMFTIRARDGIVLEFYDTLIVIWRDPARGRHYVHTPTMSDADFDRLLRGDAP
jgi:hypothetical protein